MIGADWPRAHSEHFRAWNPSGNPRDPSAGGAVIRRSYVSVRTLTSGRVPGRRQRREFSTAAARLCWTSPGCTGSGEGPLCFMLDPGHAQLPLRPAPKPRTRSTLIRTHTDTPLPGADTLRGAQVVWCITLTTGSDRYSPLPLCRSL